MNLYCAYDKVSKRFSHFMLAETRGEYVREMVCHRIAFPQNFNDVQLLEVDTHFFADPTVYKPVDWSEWRAPETVADTLAPLGLGTEETIQIARAKIEQQIEECRKNNRPVPKELADELNLYVKER